MPHVLWMKLLPVKQSWMPLSHGVPEWLPGRNRQTKVIVRVDTGGFNRDMVSDNKPRPVGTIQGLPCSCWTPLLYTFLCHPQY